MQTRQITFAARDRVVCETVERELHAPETGALVELRYTCISAGTELAKRGGLQPVDYPLGPLGNRAVGRVLEPGSKRADLRPGDFVFCHGPHASHFAAHGLVVRLPVALDRPETALMGMALVAFTGVRVAQPELGDAAVVTGGGLVGQFAAQLLQINGVKAILIEPVPGRLEIARQIGIEHAIAADDAADRVMDLTQGRGADHILECTGVPAVVEGAVNYAGRSAQLILIGSPRGEHPSDLTAFLNSIHLWRPRSDLTLKGAHEWKIPLYPDHHAKHSITRNLLILSELIAAGKLRIAPLLTAVFDPDDAQQAYDRMRDEKDRHLGTVFAWT